MKSFGHLFWVCNPAIEIREERQQLLQGSKEDKKKKKKKKKKMNFYFINICVGQRISSIISFV